jgi:hypothetical protein
VIIDEVGVAVVLRDDEPTEDDLRAIKAAHPEARTVLWGDERYGLRRFASRGSARTTEDQEQATPIEGGLRSPSATIQVQDTKNLDPIRAEVEQALKDIDGVHRVTELPPVPLRARRIKANGAYQARPNLVEGTPNPEHIYINPDKPERSALTTAHEVGHYIDHTAWGSPLNYGSSESLPELRPLMEAIRTSDGHSTLERIRETLPDYRKHLDYLLSPEELFARAYSQYIALRSQNPEMLNDVEYRRSGVFITDQWNDRDFAPIAAEFDKLFAKKGWRVG